VRIDTVEREQVTVIYAASPGEWNAIPTAAARAFERLETVIPPRGRKIYGYWHPPELEYRACYAREPGDEPQAVGLEEDALAAGRYRRARLRGENVFAQIPVAFETLEGYGGIAQDGRPWLEYYRRHDKVDLLVPISGA
jgi:hypothetical protein